MQDPAYVGCAVATMRTGEDPFTRLKMPEVTQADLEVCSFSTAHLRRDPAALLTAQSGRLARNGRCLMAAHLCHAPGCKTAVPPKMFACRPHWFALPKAMRDAIWATYRDGQEVTKDPSPEYLEAARAAVEYLRSKAGA